MMRLRRKGLEKRTNARHAGNGNRFLRCLHFEKPNEEVVVIIALMVGGWGWSGNNLRG